MNVSLVAARRYPIVDEEAGGRIRTIYAAMFYPPPDAPVPNWPPYEGNWPLPASSPDSTEATRAPSTPGQNR